MIERSAVGVPEHPGILEFRKEDRKRDRQSITSTPGFEKLSTALYFIHKIIGLYLIKV
jgi:hypothetical protein